MNNYLKFQFAYNNHILPLISGSIKLIKSYDAIGNFDLCTANHKEYNILVTNYIRKGISFDDALSTLNKGIHHFNGDIFCDKDNSMVIIVHTEKGRKEYLCDAVHIGKSITLTSSHHILHIEAYKSFVHGDYVLSEAIELDDTLIGVELLAYKNPHQLPISITTNEVLSNYPSIKLYERPYDGGRLHGYGLRTYPITFLLEVNWEKRQIFCSSRKTVDYYEYTTISHASMDPGPEEHSEQTTWEAKAMIQFYNYNDINAFISRCKDIEEINWHKDKSNYSFYKSKEYASMKDAELDLGIKLIERWY